MRRNRTHPLSALLRIVCCFSRSEPNARDHTVADDAAAAAAACFSRFDFRLFPSVEHPEVFRTKWILLLFARGLLGGH